MSPKDGMLRSPTFFVGAERQKKNLEDFHRHEQSLTEAYHKNKPLCFNARSYQRTHPAKVQKGREDADVTLCSPMICGVADGVSQIEEFGIDASLLPRELLKVCEELAMYQLVPGEKLPPHDAYQGPIPLLRRAFQATQALGSLTVVLGIMDNSTRIHGKLHPMIAIITIGDCELLVLRRTRGRFSPLQVVCHTEMQRIDGNTQTPLQLARVDDRIDPDFHEGITIEVIEKGSAVHCVSAYEGDIVVTGSDGVFDNLFLDEVMELSNSVLPPGPQPVDNASLALLAQRIIEASHAKTSPLPNGKLPEAPIGPGGKKDDTSVVVAEVVEWTEAHRQLWAPRRKRWPLQNILGKFMPFERCCTTAHDSDDDFDARTHRAASPESPFRGTRELAKEQAQPSQYATAWEDGPKPGDPGVQLHGGGGTMTSAWTPPLPGVPPRMGAPPHAPLPPPLVTPALRPPHWRHGGGGGGAAAFGLGPPPVLQAACGLQAKRLDASMQWGAAGPNAAGRGPGLMDPRLRLQF